MSFYAGGGFGIYFGEKGASLRVFELLGWGLGETSLMITILTTK